MLDDGRALRRMERLVAAQGGDPGVVREPARLERAPVVREVFSDAAGDVVRLDPRPLGAAVVAMGGGRTRLGEAIDPRVGFRLAVAPGHRVEKGQAIAEVHAADQASADLGERAIGRAVHVGREVTTLRPLVSHRVSAAGTERVTIG